MVSRASMAHTATSSMPSNTLFTAPAGPHAVRKSVSLGVATCDAGIQRFCSQFLSALLQALSGLRFAEQAKSVLSIASSSYRLQHASHRGRSARDM